MIFYRQLRLLAWTVLSTSGRSELNKKSSTFRTSACSGAAAAAPATAPAPAAVIVGGTGNHQGVCVCESVCNSECVCVFVLSSRLLF